VIDIQELVLVPLQVAGKNDSGEANEGLTKRKKKIPHMTLYFIVGNFFTVSSCNSLNIILRGLVMDVSFKGSEMQRGCHYLGNDSTEFSMSAIN